MKTHNKLGEITDYHQDTDVYEYDQLDMMQRIINEQNQKKKAKKKACAKRKLTADERQNYSTKGGAESEQSDSDDK